jgi:uncharacterized protein (DUF488 family)
MKVERTPMYYRRKILLALIEIFGGNLHNTDCEKLLFNFCKVTGKNYYDFFPHRFGPFSIVSYYDKQRLTELGLLKHTQSFSLNTNHSYFKDLRPSDQKAMLALKASNVRGSKLIKKIYRENPQFTSRSEILEQRFDSEEIKHLKFAWNTDKSPMIFTIGYEGETIDSFLYKLISNNVTAVIDIRNNPLSMKFGFSKKSFKDYVEKTGMKYFHIPELGIPSAMRKGLGQKISYKRLFENYENRLLPELNEAKDYLLKLINKYSRVALVCFEADHHYCHRSILLQYLKKKRVLKKPVFHL